MGSERHMTKKFTVNEYGNIDIRKGMPKGSTHISKSEYGTVQVKKVCEKLGVAYAPALVGFDHRRGFWKPDIDGIVIWSRCRSKVMEEVARRQEQIDKRKQSKPSDYSKTFAKQYNSQDDALLDAAHAMLNLNRYCKHSECSYGDRDTIYNLKNGFVRFLYERGHSTDVGLHVIEKEEKECWNCDGLGCERCCDTGIYLEADIVRFYVFHFRINDVPFCWHQPEWTVKYPVEVTVKDAPMPEIGIKSLEIEDKRFEKAKSLALVEWVMDQDLKKAA